MDLIRLIKLKSINGEFDNITQVESKFISYLGNLKFMYKAELCDNDGSKYLICDYGVRNTILVKHYVNYNYASLNYIWLLNWKLDEVDSYYTIGDLDDIFTRFIQLYLGLSEFKCRIMKIS